VLLTDVVMPGITGEAFAARVKTMRPDIRVLFMSGYQRPGGGEPSAGMYGWPKSGTPVIGKPFTRAALLARITQVLADDTHADQVEQPERQLVRVRRR
jgi:two-component system cell cycle sensor histidine kinase/response regulator CckA